MAQSYWGRLNERPLERGFSTATPETLNLYISYTRIQNEGGNEAQARFIASVVASEEFTALVSQNLATGMDVKDAMKVSFNELQNKSYEKILKARENPQFMREFAGNVYHTIRANNSVFSN
jgi:hypothetical protein